MNRTFAVTLGIAVLAVVGAWMRWRIQELLNPPLEGTSSGLALAVWPWGTLLVNAIGCFVIGGLFAIYDRGILFERDWLIVSLGFLGSLTTFSSFALEVLRLARTFGPLAAGSYWLASNFICILICYLGSNLALQYVTPGSGSPNS